MTSDPTVDVVIPVHSASRPIARAVASVLDGTSARVRVSVIIHNTDPTPVVANLGETVLDARLRLMNLTDGVRSPAGPLNLGLAAATAGFTAILGSDDELQPGAIDSWLEVQQRWQASMVLARIHHSGRGDDPYPPVRPARRNNLDPVRDRLPYRSAPLGLISMDHFGDLRFTEGLASGEDLAYGLRIWFSGHSIAFDAAGPAYVVRNDERDRVTAETRDMSEDFRFLDEIYTREWFSDLNETQRELIALKFVRLHVFDAILGRVSTGNWTEQTRRETSAIVDRILHTAPRASRLLSRADRAVLHAVHAGQVPPARLAQLLRLRWNYRSPKAVVPANVLMALHRQAPLRTLAAGLLVSRAATHL